MRGHVRRRAGLFIVVAGLAARSVAAQEHPIRLTVGAIPPFVRSGDTARVVVRAAIPPGWHLYSPTQPPGGPIATNFEARPTSIVRVGSNIQSPPALIAHDPNFDIESEWYEDSARFVLPLSVASTARAGRHDVDLIVGYQTCTNRFCLPPREDTLRIALTVEGTMIAGSAAGDPPTATATPRAPAARVAAPTVVATAAPPLSVARSSTIVPVNDVHAGSGSFGLFLWLAATMGLLSLLTPCVFPMVPITISYFSKRESGSRAGAAGDAALYAGGIVVAFTGLGVGLSLLMGVAGLNRFAANPWLNLGIAALFIVFALGLFGLLNLALPSGLLNRLDRAATASPIGRTAATLLMGVTFALTTFTCTAPFVGTLLVSASRGNWRWPTAGLLVFSSVFALPFLILALVPRALSRLPRSGEWMVTMKGALGFIELAAALKFVSNADLVQGWGIFTRQVVVAIWLIIAVLLAGYLAGVRLSHWRVSRPARGHGIATAAALATTLFLSLGLTGRRLGELDSFLPPAGARADGVSGGAELSWRLDDFDGALRQAKAEKRLVLIDFTGFTCTNCRWMEANMFPRADVSRELKQFVRVRLFTDGQGDRYRQQQAFEQQRFQTAALPLYAIVDSLGEPRATFLGMTRDTREFVDFLSGARGAP
jgi:thiol:disulfide interchange protein